jgi:uncharacterized coiled-coil DUF342 family protein
MGNEDIQTLKSDVAILKNDVQKIKEDMSEIKDDIKNINNSVNDMRVLIAGNYVTKQEMNEKVNELKNERNKIIGVAFTVTSFVWGMFTWVYNTLSK